MKFQISLLFLLVFSIAAAQPNYRSSVTHTGTTATVNINCPTGTAANEVLVAGLMYDKGAAEVITPPAGWQLIRRTDNGYTCGMATYYKITNASEPAAYTFTLNNGSKWSIGVSRITEINISSPIDVTSSNIGSGTSVVASPVTTTGNNRLVLCFYSNGKGTTYSTTPGVTKRYDQPNTAGISNMMATFIQSNPGPTGSKSASPAEADMWAAQQIALSPSVSVLPIELVSFTGELCSSSSVCLKWTTATETNNRYFSMERSADGLQWESITETPGAGTSTAMLHYSFTDEAPLSGNNYYRLKQADYDGKYEYSKIVVVNKPGMSIDVYPNPAVNSVKVTMHESSSLPLLMNDRGEQIDTSVISTEINTYTLDLSRLQPGLYFIRAGGTVKRVVKM